MKQAQFIKALCQVGGLVAVLAAAPAHALTLTDTGVDKFTDQTLKRGSNAGWAERSLGAWEVRDDTAQKNKFWVYCLDPLNAYSNPNQNVGVTDLSWFTGNPSAYRALFSNAPYTTNGMTGNTNTANVKSKLTALYEHAYFDSLTSDTKSSAFQYAIWEIESEATSNAYSRNDGRFRADGTSAFDSQVDAYLTALNNNNWGNVGGKDLSAASKFVYSVYLPNEKGQVVMSVKEDKLPPGQIPEPSTFALAGLALFGVAYTRRQTKRK